MNLTKNIIDEIVSYIDLKDIRDFVINNPQLVKAEETIKNLFWGSFISAIKIRKNKDYDFILKMEGAKQNDWKSKITYR